jgi:hypothetical protein
MFMMIGQRQPSLAHPQDAELHRGGSSYTNRSNKLRRKDYAKEVR